MEPSDRRAEILEAAQAVFVLRGRRATTVDEITSRAGIAKGTFYLYFDSKDAVLHELSEQYCAELLRHVEGTLKRKNRGQAISDFIDAVADFKSSHRPVSALFMGQPEGFPIAASEQAIRAGLARFIADGTRAEAFEVRDADAVATLLWGSLEAAFDDRRDAGQELAMRSAAKEVFRAVLLRKAKKK